MEKTAIQAFSMPANQVGELLGSLNAHDLGAALAAAVPGILDNAKAAEAEQKPQGNILRRAWGMLKLAVHELGADNR